MSASFEGQDMMDVLASNCADLTESLTGASNLNEKQTIVVNYLKKADKASQPITDFKEDLDWFNVTEALSFDGCLRGKVVVMDFFTYCCINCMHVLPDLKRLEGVYSVEDGLVVVGVHSAKFANEKDSRNIRSAVLRYEISHPVVNDNTSSMWRKLRVQCWPTLLILGPNANPLFVIMGEGQYDDLKLYVDTTLKFYKAKGQISDHSLPISLASCETPSHLQFPGKIASTGSVGYEDSEPELFAISDSGNHRVLVINADGDILFKIGGKSGGFVDGDFEIVKFNAPQGVCFLNRDTLFVADNENHAIRKIDLKARTVTTVVGNGKQGNDRTGGRSGRNQAISSPWDVAVCSTSETAEDNVVLIAMAGIHQIWALFLEDTVWWKSKKFAAGSCHAIVGSGREENRNNSYPHIAAFAQPSGLAMNRAARELYVADSESSSIRRMSTGDGKVTAIAGGDRNPLNLFAFGDIDGKQLNAKFQHPLGVAYNPVDKCIYMTDTYNHKVKKIEPIGGTATTCDFVCKERGTVWRFNEPAGLCTDRSGQKLYIADTNNHQIMVANLSDMSIYPLKVQFHTGETEELDSPGNVVNYGQPIKLHPNISTIRLRFALGFPNPKTKMTEGAPQKWSIQLSSSTWECTEPKGTIDPSSSEFTLDFTRLGSSGFTTKSIDQLIVQCKLNLCEKDICFPKELSVRLSLQHLDESTTANIEQTEMNQTVMLQVSRKEVTIPS